MRTFRIILIVILMIGFTGIAMMPESTIPETLCSSPNYRIIKKGNKYTVIDHGSIKTYFETASGEQPIQVQQALNSCNDELEDL